MVSKNWLDLGWERPRIKLCWVLPLDNITGIWLQKDKLKVIQPKEKENSWLKNYTAKTLLSPKLPNIIYDFFQHVPKELNIFFFTKTVDSVSRALIGYSISEYPTLFTDSPSVPPSERRQTRISFEQNAFRFAAVTNKEISQLIKQAVPEIQEERDEVRGGSFNR